MVEAAKDAFWRLGYDGAAVSDLEAATGLSRSSLYQAFGSKRRLFAEALDAYIEGFIGPLLAPLEAPQADGACVDRFVRHLAAVFTGDGLPARYGCLWANSIAARGRHGDADVDVRAAEYWERLQNAYANGLRHAALLERAGLIPPEERAGILAAATFGGWLTVPIDGRRAVAVCHAMLAELASWRRPPANPRRQ
ncbi:MAG: TetR/AcrR family transcriptional regulator [Candidatus Dormibacteria bacterium]